MSTVRIIYTYSSIFHASSKLWTISHEMNNSPETWGRVPAGTGWQTCRSWAWPWAEQWSASAAAAASCAPRCAGRSTRGPRGSSSSPTDVPQTAGRRLAGLVLDERSLKNLLYKRAQLRVVDRRWDGGDPAAEYHRRGRLGHDKPIIFTDWTASSARLVTGLLWTFFDLHTCSMQ